MLVVGHNLLPLGDDWRRALWYLVSVKCLILCTNPILFSTNHPVPADDCVRLEEQHDVFSRIELEVKFGDCPRVGVFILVQCGQFSISLA
jgi:hypothetical protein